MDLLSHYLSENPAQLLELIEYRTALVNAKQRQAAAILLDLPVDVAIDPATVSLADLARSVDAWRSLLPEDPAVRRALRNLLAERSPDLQTVAPALWTLLSPDERGDVSATAGGADDTPTLSLGAGVEAAPFELTDDELVSLVADALSWQPVRRGERLYNQGDPASTLYVVVDGLIHLLRTDAGGVPVLVGTVSEGSLLGERSLVLDEPRSTTAYAAQDSNVYTLPLTTLQQLLPRAPKVMVKLLVELATRTQLSSAAPASPRHGRVLAILPAVAGCEPFVQALVEDLSHYGTTLFMRAEDAQAELAEFGPNALEGLADSYGLIDWMQRQARMYEYVLYLGDAESPNWSRRIAEQADRMLIVGRAGDSPVLSPLEVQLNRLEHPELLPPQELVLLHATAEDNPGDTAAWLDKRTIRRHHHVALDTGKGVDRVSRFVRGRAVAFVFGGGGMRAAACAGVAKALNELGIRADVVGGTSAGSLAAAIYAMDMDVDAMIEITRNQLMQKKIWMQPTLPLISVMSAKRLNAAYQDVYGGWQMEDMWITPFTISGNLTRAEMVVHQRGPLHHAVRASTAIAGVMPPALNDAGDLLIDGGIFNNTPADVARTLVDTGPVIAVDLGFTKRQETPYAYGESLSGWKVFRHRVNPFAEKIDVPSIVGIMMRANALGSINATAEQISYADLLLQPPVSDYGLFDFDAFDEVVQAGYDYALDPIRQWLADGGMEGV